MVESSKIKIIHIWKDLDTFYGVHDQLLTLASFIDKNIFELGICVFQSEGGSLEQQFRRLGVPVYNLRIRWNNPLAIWRLFKVLRRIKPHIVQTYVLNTNIFGRIAGIIARVPVIIGTELTLKDQVSSKAKCIRDWFLYPLNSLLNLLSDSVIFVSEAVKQEWVGKTMSAKYQVIYSPFNYEKFRSVSNYEKQFLQNKAGPMLGIVARLSEEKGHTDLLDSLPKILKWFPGTKLIVVGTGYLEECLRQRMVNLGLENHVTFEGHKKNVFEGLSKLDIFVLPSRSEGMGIAIVEAMAMGLPVVATKVGGIPEVVVDGVTGILVPPKNPARLADAIIDLISDPEKAKGMGIHGKARALQIFHPSEFVRAHEQLYKKLLKEKFHRESVFSDIST